MLIAKNLEARYGQARILFDVGVEMGHGEVVVLLGRNGAGKSTTLKALMGLVRPTSGEVRFLGERIDGLSPHEIARRGLGYVPEDRRIFTDLTVRENLEVGRQAPRGQAPQWTAGRVFDLFPDLAGMQDRIARDMSGGEQQMLTIARTLMGNPRCILLDEPSEGLGPVIVAQMSAVIRDLKSQGLSVLLSEQNLRFATEVADRAYVLEKGRVRFYGTVAELSANEEARKAYLAL